MIVGKTVGSEHRLLSSAVLKYVDVQKNVASLQKQIDAVHVKLENAQSVSDTAIRNQEGLPVTDIYEELDEDGNVICKLLS